MSVATIFWSFWQRHSSRFPQQYCRCVSHTIWGKTLCFKIFIDFPSKWNPNFAINSSLSKPRIYNCWENHPYFIHKTIDCMKMSDHIRFHDSLDHQIFIDFENNLSDDNQNVNKNEQRHRRAYRMNENLLENVITVNNNKRRWDEPLLWCQLDLFT